MFQPRPYFANPALADTLETVVAGGFYPGDTAARHRRPPAGWLAGDLEAHRNDWVEPLRSAIAATTLLELPPNGQGSIAGWALESLRSPELPDQVRGAGRRLRARLRHHRRHRLRLRGRR